MRRHRHYRESGPHRNANVLALQQRQNVKQVSPAAAKLMKIAIQELMMTRQHVVPDDFPREPSPGLVPGTQPKLLVREVAERYYAGLTDDELWTRYDACVDLAGQLAEYASRKMSMSGLSLDDILGRVERGLKAKVGAGQWEFSGAEIAWTLNRTRMLLSST